MAIRRRRRVTACLMLAAVGGRAAMPACAAEAPPAVVVGGEALRVHAATFVFDGHNDLPWKLRTTIEQIELVEEMIRRHPETFALALSAEDVDRCRAAGRIASLIGIEGGHCIEDSLANLRRLHHLGALAMTLTHADTIGWADAATDESRHGGLSPFGVEVVREMNRLGMLVDLSHVSPETMRHALRVTAAPVIFSHSSARAIADHPRNVPDDVLALLPANGGVVMVNFYSGFVHPASARRRADMFEVLRRLREEFPDEAGYRAAKQRWEAEHPLERGSVHDVVDHIDHIVKVAGIDHVGIGSDFDGWRCCPGSWTTWGRIR